MFQAHVLWKSDVPELNVLVSTHGVNDYQFFCVLMPQGVLHFG